MKIIYALLLFVVLGLAGIAGFIYSGVYPIGADVPHNKVEFWLLETLRNKAIERASADISLPSLDSAELLLAGGPDYNDMCAGCHLKPGKTQSDMSLGLYPVPPNLAKPTYVNTDAQALARRQFWVIKHGIKASGMPAWGPTHDDQRIWAMVAFLQKLPQLSAQEYQILTARDFDEENMQH